MPWFKYYEDWLVERYYASGERKKLAFKGKRVSKDCPLTREEIRAYVKQGPVECVVMIRDRLHCSLREAKDLLDTTRGRNTIWRPQEVKYNWKRLGR